MKKTLVSALTTALVVGAASTTFAAANPFEDVPADHWAYDAVAQLAADGVIEGYGDGTYRGDQEITRYEMAQMVARAMAKGATGADKAMIDKLAAEFADELNNLGVRVAALEKKVDNVKWTGKLRYRFINRSEDKTDQQGNGADKTNQYLLRLEPTMAINEHWVGKARIDYGQKRDFADGRNITGVTVDRIYAQGKYGDTVINLGKFPEKTQADYGSMLDARIAGVGVTFGKDVKVGLYAGRLHMNDYDSFAHGGTGNNKDTIGNATASVQGIEVYNDRSKKFTWGLGYVHASNDAIFNINNDNAGDTMGNKSVSLMNLGLGYKFTKDFNMFATFGHNFNVDGFYDKGKYTNSYNVQLNYGGAKASKPGSWGLYLAYRHLGDRSTIHSTYTENGGVKTGEKGFEIGGSWALMKNIVFNTNYFIGEELASKNDVHTIWTELNLLF